MKLNIVHNENADNRLPMHLGGHQHETHIDDGALQLLIDRFDIKSYLDVGCGPGGMVELAASKGLDVLGVDGDFTLERAKPEQFLLHDYTKGPAPIGDKIYDLGWSCEFLEHVEEQYMDNYMDTFLKCKRIIVTHAFPGQGGHHHVNEKDPNYWFQQFGQRGFLLDMKTTDAVRQASTMQQRYIRVSGLVFFNSNLNWQVQ